MIELEDRQLEMLRSSADDAEGLVMGARTLVNVAGFEAGPVESREVIQERPGSDGVTRGRTWRGGRTFTLTMSALSWTPAVDRKWRDPALVEHPDVQALNVADSVESAWAEDRVRLSPGAVQVLRWRVGGRTRRVYGWPTRCAPDHGSYHSGRIPIVAEFLAADDLVYSDRETVVTIGRATPPSGFNTWPMDWPVVWSRSSRSNVGTVIVRGSRPTWPVLTIRGPIVNPVVSIARYGDLKVTANLAHDQELHLDTRPWRRGAWFGDGRTGPAVLDARGPTLQSIRFPPGEYEFALEGADPSNRSSLSVRFRDAFSSI